VPGGIEERVSGFLASVPFDSGAGAAQTGGVREADPFEALALEIFHHQHSQNPAYRKWCDSTGVSPRAVSKSSDIPAVPVSAFKELEFCCGAASAEFRTSGTSGTGPGRHLLPSLDHYRISALRNFSACVMPEGWKYRTMVLAPPPRIRPASSLSQMFAWILEEQSAPASGWFVAETGLQNEKLAEALLDARHANSQALLLGTAAAFLSFYEFCDREGIRIEMPAGSRLMDTGGRKGTGDAGAGTLEDFQAKFRTRTHAILGIPAEMCVNEYGMTELSSQFYDSALLDHQAKRERTGPRVKIVPPWVRVAAVDPVTLLPLPAGQTGLLKFVDLANAGSVAAVLTEDLGSIVEGGFVLEGRPRLAEARGCGLTFDEMSRGTGTP
jgi:hypothetical protein